MAFSIMKAPLLLRSVSFKVSVRFEHVTAKRIFAAEDLDRHPSITDVETITVTDLLAVPDVFDGETVTVTDTPLIVVTLLRSVVTKKGGELRNKSRKFRSGPR